MSRRDKINKVVEDVVSKGLILGFYTPLALYIYACVLYDGIKCYKRDYHSDN